MHNIVVINYFKLLDTNCEPHGGTYDIVVTVCLQKGAKGKSYFEGAQRRARTQLKGHHKKGICVDA